MLHEYLVYRKGSNTINQPCTFDWVPIAIVRVKSRKEAVAVSWHGEKPTVHGCPSLAAEVIAEGTGGLDVYSNQTTRAVPKSRASIRDWNAVLEEDAWRDGY